MNAVKLALLTAFLTAPLLTANAHEVGRHDNIVDNSIHRAPACREFTQRVTLGGRTQTVYGTACQTRDGSWKIVSRETRTTRWDHPGRSHNNYYGTHGYRRYSSYQQSYTPVISWNNW